MKYTLIFGLALWAFPSRSCDICGGVSGNASIGLFASAQFHMVGIKSNIRTYRSYLSGIIHSHERVYQQELTGRWQLTPRWQLFATIPFQIGVQKRDLGREVISGLGDPSLIVNHVFLHHKDSSGSTKHFLSAGIGIKTPLGRMAPATSLIRNLYPGTGAWNISGLLTHTMRLNGHFSIQQEGIVTYKLADKNGFLYGNTYSIASTLIRNNKLGMSRMIVGLGLKAEFFEPSAELGVPMSVNNNQGYDFSSQISLNYLTNRWLWSCHLMQPILQNFNNGSMKQGSNVSLSVSYLIKKSKTN